MPALALLFTLCLTLLAAAGCAVSGSTKVPGVRHSPTSPEKVEVLYQPTTRPYVVIGYVTVSMGAGVPQGSPLAANKFRAEGAALGAQAVLVDQFPSSTALGVQVEGKGRAIRWR